MATTSGIEMLCSAVAVVEVVDTEDMEDMEDQAVREDQVAQEARAVS